MNQSEKPLLVWPLAEKSRLCSEALLVSVLHGADAACFWSDEHAMNYASNHYFAGRRHTIYRTTDGERGLYLESGILEVVNETSASAMQDKSNHNAQRIGQ